MYCSMGYIHCVQIGPHMSSSSMRWTTRCDITSKHVGGKTFSKVHMVFATSTFNTSMVFGSITFKQSLLNTRCLKLIRDFHVFSCINVWSQRGGNRLHKDMVIIKF